MQSANSAGRTRRRQVSFAFCLLSVAFLVVLPACAQTSLPALTTPVAPRLDSLQQLQTDIIATTQLAGVQRASWGVIVQSLDRGDRLFELNAHRLMIPASTAKLVSAASAVEAAGWDYRFETTLRTNGSIVDGVLTGDLVVVGSGDPAMGGRGGDA